MKGMSFLLHLLGCFPFRIELDDHSSFLSNMQVLEYTDTILIYRSIDIILYMQINSMDSIVTSYSIGILVQQILLSSSLTFNHHFNIMGNIFELK